MAIAELERPISRASRPHPSARGTPSSKWGERRLRSVPPLIVDDGCDVRLREGRHADAVRVALLEWLPLTRDDLLVVERKEVREAPVDALAAVVRPPTVWTADEAVAAVRLVGRESKTKRERHEVLVAYALTRLEEAHLARLRGVVARFEQQLPFVALPRASAVVARGCAAVARDDDACAAAAAIQLARYAASAFTTQRRGGAERLHLR